MSSREKKSWEWGRKQRESGRALRGSSVAQGDPLPVSGIAAGRKDEQLVYYPELFRLYCHIC